MREYVYGEKTFVLQERKDGTPLVTMSQMGDRREEIVRCRDCAYGIETANDSYMYCRMFNDPDDDREATVELDGFCAWGKTK